MMHEWAAERDRVFVSRCIAVVAAGVIAGLIALVVEIAMVWFAGATPWTPMRFIAAMLMGYRVLPPPATFDIVVLIIALVVHLVLSVAYAAPLAFGLERASMPLALLTGVAYGGFLYFVNFFWLVIVFPWFEMGQDVLTFIAHLVFGLCVAVTYKESVKVLGRWLV